MELNIELLATAIGTAIAIISCNLAIFGWIRSDMKNFEGKIEGWMSKISEEMRDFHGRLCSLESRYHSETYRQNQIKRRK
jgi:hypothetical protein